jgi:hypothetical protein
MGINTLPLVQGRSKQNLSKWQVIQKQAKWKQVMDDKWYLVHFWTGGYLMAMVCSKGDVYILTSMHPTKKDDSSFNVSDLDSRCGHFKS